ncbi:MAG: sialate O-acetylesterase [Bacteroidota bacterium]|nr:sialate O-acetylesterase [Bacteroidota bacterium]
MKRLLIVFSLFLIPVLSQANVKLPQVFSSHMVLQRNAPINIWGWAAPNERVSIQFHNQTKQAKADKNGTWGVKLDSEQAGGPYKLVVTGKNSITLDDVLVGEVWVCSGQSNMEFKLNGAMNSAQEIKAADYPQIRQITVRHNICFTPQSDILPAEWEVCSPQTAANFTAVGYFFARKLQKELNVPIGLIHTSWGGTNVETWISKEALMTNADFKGIFSSEAGGDINSDKKYKKVILNMVNKFQHNNLNAADVSDWKKAEYNDADWTKIVAPKRWEEQGLPTLDGIVWYRKEFVLTADQAKKGGVLELAKIDDSDESFVNGIKVGEKVGESIAKAGDVRHYNVSASVLKAGKNVIAIKVTDTGGDGGILGDAEDLRFVVNDDKAISLASEWKVKVDTANIYYQIWPNSYPSLLYNGMLRPVIPYSIRGAIWYQGESNADRAYQYQTTFPLMISDWRNVWELGDFPFYFVQISTYNANNLNGLTGSKWAELREAQTKALALPNTGMAVTIDVGNPVDIHPTNKQDVGLRLALNALNKTYGKDVVCSGPMHKSMEVEGNKVIVSFTETGSRLMVKDKYGYVRGFQIAGANKQFKWAKAYLQNDRVVVYSDEVQQPVAVRYAWTDNAEEANLFNKEALPASPFRTDNWDGLTVGEKYSVQ